MQQVLNHSVYQFRKHIQVIGTWSVTTHKRPYGVNWLTTGPPDGPLLFCLLASVTLQAGRRARGRSAANGLGALVADTARRASMVTSRLGDTLFYMIRASEARIYCKLQSL